MPVPIGIRHCTPQPFLLWLRRAALGLPLRQRHWALKALRPISLLSQSRRRSIPRTEWPASCGLLKSWRSLRPGRAEVGHIRATRPRGSHSGTPTFTPPLGCVLALTPPLALASILIDYICDSSSTPLLWCSGCSLSSAWPSSQGSNSPWSNIAFRRSGNPTLLPEVPQARQVDGCQQG